jgi:hypothetical protein
MRNRESDRSYLEIKVTFIHVVILLAAVIGIGFFLFYLGYQAGKSAVGDRLSDEDLRKGVGTAEEIKITDDALSQKSKAQGIDQEIRLHQQPVNRSQTKKETGEPGEKIKAKPVTRQPYYVVQVGAFENHAEARSYSDKFIKLRYPAEIQRVTVKGKIMFRVLVGHFSIRDAAKQQIPVLERLANKTGFFIRKLE